VQPGRFDLQLSLSMLEGTASHLATCPDLGPQCRTPAPPVPYYHHVFLFTAEHALEGAYGLKPWLAVEARVPFRVVRTKPTYTSLDGQPMIVTNDTHHHDETIGGFADPWLVLRLAGARGKLTTAARIGVSLPVGKTEPNPYVLGDEGKWHEHTQFGSGTFMPIVGLGVAYDLGRVQLSGSGFGIWSSYENGHGYRAPTRAFFSVRATASFRDGALRPYVAVDLPHQSNELWSGSIGAEGPTVRTELLVGGGLAWEFRAPWRVEIGLRGRVAHFTDAATFDYPGLLQIGLASHFDFRRPR
jgi:hypothetical protein